MNFISVNKMKKKYILFAWGKGLPIFLKPKKKKKTSPLNAFLKFSFFQQKRLIIPLVQELFYPNKRKKSIVIFFVSFGKGLFEIHSFFSQAKKTTSPSPIQFYKFSFLNNSIFQTYLKIFKFIKICFFGKKDYT